MNRSRFRIGIVGKGALGLGLHKLLSPIFDVQFVVDNAHLVFFCVKSYQLEAAIHQNLALISPEVPSVSLSNGWIEPFLPSKFRLGIATVAFTRTPEGKVLRKDSSGKIIWGPLEKGVKPTEVETALFKKLPLFSWSDEPREWHRQKWLFNTSLNCALAKLGLILNGEILPHILQLREIFDEAFELGELKWGEWPRDKESYWETLIKLILDTANNQNSMSADIIQKRKTEVEHLAGLALPYSGFPKLKEMTSLQPD